MKSRIKKTFRDLAIFGGEKAFQKPLFIGRPNIGDKKEFFKMLKDIFERRWLTNDGIYLLEFEKRLAGILGVKHCLAVCNATLALEIAVRALGLKGEVIVPSFTFVATAHSLSLQGIKPVFCDIIPGKHGLNPKEVEKLITPRTSAIIGVHLWGNPCAVQELSKIARKHRLKLIFDAAHAFGCSYNGKLIGNFGDAEVFSFHATKFLNTFEGGAIATNNDELALKIKLLRNFGFNGYDNIAEIGTNAKMSEASAAMGLAGLKCYKQFKSVNRRNYSAYCRMLKNMPGIKVYEFDENNKSNYQYIVIEIDPGLSGITRDDVMEILWRENIIARRYFYPGCHATLAYKKYYPGKKWNLPVTEKVCREVLCLPTGTSINNEEIIKICGIIKFCIENSKIIRDKLGGKKCPK